MDFILAIVGIIVFFVVIGLIFRLVTYTLKIVSLVILVLVILGGIASYTHVQAYVIPAHSPSYMVVTADDLFVVHEREDAPDQYTLDPVASTAWKKEALQIGAASGNAIKIEDSYREFRSFAQGEFFADADVVWLIDARTMPCDLEKLENKEQDFATACIPPKPGITQLVKNPQNLHRIPLKASFGTWAKQFFFSQAK